MLWLCWVALFLPLLADLAEDCHECGSVELLQKRARRQHVEQDDVAAQCSACCHGLKDYEVCGWCPESRSCVTITDDKSTCLVVTSENQCWGASFPASMSNYAGKIAQTFKARNKEAAVLKPLVTPYPTYAALDPPQTGIFDLASGVSLSSLQGNPAENVVIGAAADWGSGTGESMVVATLLSQEQPHLTIHLGDVYLVGDAEDYRHNVMGIDPPASRGQKGVQWPKGSHTTFLMPGNHEQIDGMNGLVEQGYSYSGQKANFGAWFSDHWRFIALDTGALCMPLGPAPNFARKLGIETSAPLTPEQVQWLNETVRLSDPSDKRGIVLMTHHYPYSDFEHAYLGAAKQLQDLLPAGRTVVWFFGHEHRFALYEKLKLKSHGFKSHYAFHGRMVGIGGYKITPKEPARHKKHMKLKAYDQRLFQKIPDDKGHKTQKLGFNGYFKIQVTGAELLATYISAKCKDETAGGCGAGYNLTHGETYANESITVDLTTGDLTQEWVYMNTGILTVPESNKQQVLEATPLPWPQNASHQGVFWNSEHTSMD